MTTYRSRVRGWAGLAVAALAATMISGPARAATAPDFTMSGPKIFMTPSDLQTSWTRIQAGTQPFADAWAKLDAQATALATNGFPAADKPANAQVTEYETYWRQGRTAAMDLRALVLAGRLKGDTTYLDQGKAFLLSWVSDANKFNWTTTYPAIVDSTRTNRSTDSHQEAGLLMGRIAPIFADAYALSYERFTPAERSSVQAWFQKMVGPIKTSRQMILTTLTNNKWNNHFGAHTLGLTAISYVTGNTVERDDALRGTAGNPVNLEAMIGGAILKPGDALHPYDPAAQTPPTGPGPAVGEMWDRMRTVPNPLDPGLHGLSYAHVATRFLVLTALITRNNGYQVAGVDRNYFAYTDAVGRERLDQPLTFYAPFLTSGRTSERTGFYSKDEGDCYAPYYCVWDDTKKSDATGYYGVDMNLLAVEEIGLRWYPNEDMKEAVEQRNRVRSDSETFGWTTLFLSASASLPDKLGRWDFDRNRPAGWAIRQNLSSSFSGGIWSLGVTATDPGLLSPARLDLPVKKFTTLHLRMQNKTTDRAGRLFFIIDADPGYSSAHSVVIPLQPNDTAQREYVVPLTDNPAFAAAVNRTDGVISLIREVRLDPVDGVSTGSVAIDSIWLASS